jgi:hypothetical protein
MKELKKNFCNRKEKIGDTAVTSFSLMMMYLNCSVVYFVCSIPVALPHTPWYLCWILAIGDDGWQLGRAVP